MKKILIFAVALAASAVIVSAQGRGRGANAAPAKLVPEPTSPVTGNAVTGKTLYYNFGCYACHGYGGETGARAFVGRWGNLSTEQAFITFLRGRANVAPLTPATNMPNFSTNSMSDKQAKDIYAYIRTFHSTAPASLAAAPALNEIVQAAEAGKK